MTRIHTRTAHIVICLAALLLVAAQAAPSEPARGFGFAYDPAQEITITGTVTQLVSHPAPGMPMGTHLLISSSGKTVDAHVGPYLSKDTKDALKVGQLIQITGVNERVHGQNVLLARQLILAGRQVTVRNERGFLVRFSPRGNSRDGKPAVFRNTQGDNQGGNQ